MKRINAMAGCEDVPGNPAGVCPWLFLPFLGTLIFVTACLGPMPGKRTHYRLGIHHFDRGEYADAAREFSLAVKADDGNLNALFNLGLSHLKNGDYPPAVDTYRTYVARRPDSAEGHINLAFSLAGMDHEAEAVRHFTRAIELEETRAFPYCAYVQFLLAKSQGEADETAAELMDRAMEVDRGDATAPYLRGLVRLRLNDRAGAAGDFQRAVDLDPNHQPALVRLGDSAYHAGDYGRAARYYARAAVLDPQDLQAFLGAGRAFGRTGNFEKALSALWRAKDLAPENPSVTRELAFTALAAASVYLGKWPREAQSPSAEDLAELEALLRRLQER